MPKYKNRICLRCALTDWTTSKSNFCRLCAKANVRDEIILREGGDLIKWGYKKLAGPTLDKFNHRVYTVIALCGHEWAAPYNNILKQQKLSEKNGTPQPCPTCGGKRRMEAALAGYIEKNGRDYDLTEYQDYVKVVRGLSDKTFKKHKHELNPNNLRRGMKTYHLDHKIPIIECFKRGWTPEQAAAKENLELLPWSENLTKGRTHEISL